MSLSKLLSLVLVLAFAASATAQTSAPAEPPATPLIMPPDSQPSADPLAAAQQARIAQLFLQHVASLANLDPAARTAINRIWQQADAGSDAHGRMVSAIAVLSKEYKEALDALDADRAAKAVETIKPALRGEDFYITAHAQALHARALLELDQFAEAQDVLNGLYQQREELAARTFLSPEVLFLLGYCRLHDVDYEGAAQIFQEFEAQFPLAPDQYRLPVRQMLQEMAGRKPEGLGDVSDLMNYAGRQLKHARINEVVQTRQTRAVELLSKLIEEAEQREQEQQQQQQQQQQQNQQSDGKSGAPQGNQQPQRGATDRSHRR